MTAFTVLTREELDQALSPEEVEEQDAVLGQEVKEVSSPFSNLLSNLFSGGGRSRRDRVQGGDLNLDEDPTGTSPMSSLKVWESQ